MTFKEYYRLLPESFIGELASKYDTLNMSQIQHDYPIMMQYCIDWAMREGIGDDKVRSRLKTSTNKLFKWCDQYRPQAIQMLKDLHELEYKQSQLKKFYSNPEAMRTLELTMIKIAKWLQIYLGVVLFSRAAGDGVNMDGKIPTVPEVLNDPGFKHIVNGRTIHGVPYEQYDNYITPVFMELYKARSLSQLLIAISKAKNAEHDGGAIMTEWGTGLFFGNENAFEEIGNLNYRKLDRELQQELNNDV